MKNIIIDFVTYSVVYREQGNYAEKGGKMIGVPMVVKIKNIAHKGGQQ